MAEYTLLPSGMVLRTDGATIPPDPDNTDYQRFLAWSALNVPDSPVAPAVAPLRRIAALAFRRRIPLDQLGAITVAAAQAAGAGQPQLQIVLDNLASSRLVELDLAETQDGVALLLAGGLITQATATALLADGQPAEAPDAP